MYVLGGRAISLFRGKKPVTKPLRWVRSYMVLFPPSGFRISPIRFYLPGSPIIRHFIWLQLPLESWRALKQPANLIYYFLPLSQRHLFLLLTNVPFCQESFWKKKKTTACNWCYPKKARSPPLSAPSPSGKRKKKKSFKNLLPFWGLKHQKTSLSRLGQSALGPGSYNIELKADSSHKRLALLPLKSDPFFVSRLLSPDQTPMCSVISDLTPAIPAPVLLGIGG